MRWTVRGRRKVYESEWVEVWVDEVQPPAGDSFEHHVVRMPKATVAAVVIDDQERVLLLWRHRFITDAWGWEVPAGWVEPNEDSRTAVLREIEEETGWRAAAAEPLVSYNTLSGISDLRMEVFLASDVTPTGAVVDTIESCRVEWVPLARVPDLVRKGEIPDGVSLTALTYYLSMR